MGHKILWPPEDGNWPVSNIWLYSVNRMGEISLNVDFIISESKPLGPVDFPNLRCFILFSSSCNVKGSLNKLSTLLLGMFSIVLKLSTFSLYNNLLKWFSHELFDIVLEGCCLSLYLNFLIVFQNMLEFDLDSISSSLYWACNLFCLVLQ